MTIVECFESAPYDNMLSTLTANPDKLIFIGVESVMENVLPVYKRILKEKGYKTQIESRNIIKNSLQNIIDTVTDIAKTHTDCIFDITGGEDLVLLAVGIVFERLKNTHPFKMQRFNINTGKLIDCDLDDEVIFEGKYSVFINDLISLHGGVVVPEDPQPDQEITADDIDPIWDVAKEEPISWNKFNSYLNEFENKGGIESDELIINLNLSLIRDSVVNYNEKLQTITAFLEKLYKNRVLNKYAVTDTELYYEIKNAFVKKALKKAGNVLELKVFLESRDLCDKGKPYFSDCFLSTTIDWDGVIHDRKDTKKDTRNEIDVMLMKGLVPIFISCKNGTVDEDELYKLDTVATRFGGKHAKKILVATKFDTGSVSSDNHLIQRANDMKITFIENAADYSKKEWKKLVKGFPLNTAIEHK